MKDFFERQTRRKTWQHQWPEYCRNCGGAGMFPADDDPSPAMVSVGICICCLERGICPRCGCAFSETENGKPAICSFCGWDKEHPDICPPPPNEGYPSEDDPISLVLRKIGASQVLRDWYVWGHEMRETPERYEQKLLNIVCSVDLETCNSQVEFEGKVRSALHDYIASFTDALQALKTEGAA